MPDLYAFPSGNLFASAPFYLYQHKYNKIMLNVLKAFFSQSEEALRRAVRHMRRTSLNLIYQRYSDLTMIRVETYVDNLELARRAVPVSGCVVECGVWRGGMSAGMSEVVGSHRNYFLVDSFEGLPPPKELDGQAAVDWQKDVNSPGYHNNCGAEESFAKEAMARASCKNYRLVRGWFENTVPTLTFDEPIALLRLDGDWYESTMTCLTHLYDKVADGGMIIIDDYFAWDGCARAVHDFLSQRSALERLRTHGNVCYMIKASTREGKPPAPLVPL